MQRAATSVILICILATVAASQQRSADQEKVWGLERAYWSYVKGMELDKYRALWHTNFVGWPLVSPTPVRKDHITDWISESVNKGLTLKSHELEPLAIQITDNVAVTHYRVTVVWADKDGKGEPKTSRITHTWIRVGDGWQIIGGMSAPADAQGR